MKWFAEIETKDIKEVRNTIELQSDHPIMDDRFIRNVSQPPPTITEETMWESMIMCLITTQNKSGSGSSVDMFLSSRPFPLSLSNLRTLPDVNSYIEQILSELRIRRWKISTDSAIQNLQVLEEGGWLELFDLSLQLGTQRSLEPEEIHYILERTAAQSVQGLLKGLGPKQSRNFWQYLGKTRYEIPLDSRVLRWLRDRLGFYIPSTGLSDERFYSQVMDIIRMLCLEAKVLPCMLDAAIFSLYESS